MSKTTSSEEIKVGTPKQYYTISVRFSPEEEAVLRKESERLGVTMNKLVRFCVFNYAPLVTAETETKVVVITKKLHA